jgi:hypothetical protein
MLSSPPLITQHQSKEVMLPQLVLPTGVNQRKVKEILMGMSSESKLKTIQFLLSKTSHFIEDG